MAVEVKYTKLFINNEFVDARSGKTFETYSPHDNSVIAKVAEGGKADIDAAVEAASKAFHRNSEWRKMEPEQRAKLLNKFADLVDENMEYLNALESYNNGTVKAICTHFLADCSKIIKFYASLADKYHGETLPSEGKLFTYTTKQPIGVCGLILPWNGPIRMFINKVAPALAAGCTVVVKPAEQTPLTALVLGALLREAGFPPGVVNIVNGFGVDAGVALTHHPKVAKISFTGSLEVGKLIQQAAGATNLKRITLELGGKSPLIIMDDADLNIAVPAAAAAVFVNQGQVCVAASRLFVQAGIYDKFVKAATEHARKIKIGCPNDPTAEHGPQVDQVMREKVLNYINIGVKEGAKLMAGGKRHGTTGNYIQPTVFADVTDDMTIAREEIFGPVQNILKFDTLEEVMDRANDTKFGLAAGIFTTNMDNALLFSKHIESGVVWVNTYLMLPPQLPFGGFKDSGIGREGGVNALEDYMETKSVCISLNKQI